MTAAHIDLRPAFSFTFHATDRFMSRVWPSIAERPCADAREALTILSDAATRAEMLPRRTGRGHAVWQIADPSMRWITKPGTYRGQRVAVVVTLLGGADDVEAEEEAEREVLEAHRRLEAVPEIGTPEPTSPPPACCSGCTARWLEAETQRLAVERTRLRSFLHAHQQVDVNAAVRERTVAIRQEIYKQQQGHHSKMSAKDRAIQTRNILLFEAAAALERADPVDSRDLCTRLRKIAKSSA